MIYELFECLISWSNWCSTMIGFLSCFLPQNSHSKSTLPAGFKFSLLGPSKLMNGGPHWGPKYITRWLFESEKKDPAWDPLGEDSRMVKWDPFSPAAAFWSTLKGGDFFFFFGGGGCGRCCGIFVCLYMSLPFFWFLILMALYTFSVMHLTALRRLSREWDSQNWVVALLREEDDGRYIDQEAVTFRDALLLILSSKNSPIKSNYITESIQTNTAQKDS